MCGYCRESPGAALTATVSDTVPSFIQQRHSLTIMYRNSAMLVSMCAFLCVSQGVWGLKAVVRGGESQDEKSVDETEAVTSRARDTQATTKPLLLSKLYLLSDIDVLTTLVAIYTPTPATDTVFDSYRFSVSPASPSGDDDGCAGAAPRDVIVDAAQTDHLVKFERLVPGCLYNVTMVTVSNNVSSDPLSRLERLKPGDVGELRAKRVSDTKATVQWSAPDGYYTDFEVLIRDEAGALPLPRPVTRALSYDAEGLTPRTNYTVIVTVRAGDTTTDTGSYSSGRSILLQM